MPIPAGYTQLTTGFWRKDSDLSGPYAWTGAAFYLISTGVAGSGVPADYTQHPSGFWFKTADGSGPYSYDGTDFWLAGNGGPSGAITVATVNVSSAINMANGATFNLYNTADQTTNYERLRADWSGNVAQVWTGIGGTGIARTLRIGSGTSSGGTAPTRYMEIGTSGIIFTSTNNAASGASVTISSVGQLSASSGTQYGLTIGSTINQSGTAGATILNVDPTVSATGSGSYLIQRWGWGGTTRAQIDNSGGLFVTGFASTGLIGFASSIGGTADVTLFRDAAYTLAQRNGTNAQTFCIYNTHTDASNYRRWNLSWNTTTAIMQVVGAGTGTNGNLAVGNAALATTATVGYFMIPSSAGAPTGVPADIPTGQVALHFDSTNNKLYVYDGGWLSTAALT